MKKNIYILTLSLLAISLSGCNDFLDKNPTNRAELASPEDLRSLLVSAYPETTYFPFAETMSDNVTDVGDVVSDDISRRKYYHWEQNNEVSQDTPNGFFSSSYTSIAIANQALRAIDRIVQEGKYTQEEMNPYKGEALFTRGYNHFMLVNFFAEHYDPNTAETDMALPYITTIEEQPEVKYQRLTVKAMYDLIEKDLLEGYNLINDNVYPDTKKWHFNKAAAGIMLSRFYLYRGLTTPDANGMDDFDKVIKYATEAVSTQPTIRDWTKTYNIPLEDFLSWYCSSREDANLLIVSAISTGSQHRTWSNRYTMNINLLQQKFTSATPHPTKNKIDYLLGYRGYGNSTIGCYAIFTINEYFKRSGINANYGYPYVMFNAITSEEGLFNLAEAYVMKGNYQQVRNLLNIYYSKRAKGTNTGQLYNPVTHEVTDQKIREIYNGDIDLYATPLAPHYALSADQLTYLRCVLNIRSLEFWGQGLRWFDIKRMHIPITHKVFPNQQITLSANDPRRVIPLPEDAIRGLENINNSSYSPTNTLNMYPALTFEQISALQPVKE